MAAEEAASEVKPRWGDEPEDELQTGVEALKINSDSGDKDGQDAAAGEDGTVDKPDISLKSGVLRDAPEDAKIQKEIVDEKSLYSSAKRFEDLDISEPLLRALYAEMKFDRPSKIQAEALPLILNPPYTSLVAQAHNGSGKTTCFVLGMLSRVDPSVRAPQALCICPTRELALQNETVLKRMAKFSGITSVCAIPQERSEVRYERRPRVEEQVVIGTPGTMKRRISEKSLSLERVKIIVFDEADHMLDQGGFRDDSVRIMKQVQRFCPDCQILLFSATFSEKVKEFVERTILKANKLFVEKEKLSLDVIKQYRVKCPSKEDKFEVLKERIYPLAEKLGQSIIFTRTRENVNQLSRHLEAEGYDCSLVHGGLRPEERDAVINDFRSGKARILISTDVLARGFDVATVTLVINFDLPVVENRRSEADTETYLHRIGRSGRFGRKGAAFNFMVTQEDDRVMSAIERHFERVIPSVQWDDEEAFEKAMKEAGLR